jgi:predicted AlkP superfamily phosphohydrolase/phosphomutase
MRTLLLGFDAFDPNIVEALIEKGKLPNLRKWAESSRYSRFQVSNPAQSEVSWTSIATGLNPGDHGMFDFVHRDPQTYALSVSLLPTGKGLGGIQFLRPYNARTIFDTAAERGYPATSLWWPGTFPARPDSPVRTLPGLGTPDIQGRLGVGTFYTTDPNRPEKMGKTPVRPLESRGSGRYAAQFEGPLRGGSQGAQSALLDLALNIQNANQIELRIGNQSFPLQLGKWSPIIELNFKLGFLVSVRAITRVIVTQIEPVVRMYVLPLQIHPLHAIWRYGTPASFVKNAWKVAGPFLTLGWPQDTTGLEDGCIDDDHFLDLCDQIVAARFKLLMHLLGEFQEGLLASVFDTLDRVQHMFFKQKPELIESWYQRFDDIAGQVSTRLASLSNTGREPARMLIVSDHGFQRFDYKVNLNRWLIDQGYLAPSNGAANGAVEGDLKSVDWSRSQAYAVGLNSIYLNQAGREGQGSLPPASIPAFLDDLCARLEDWTGPDGRPVVQKVYRRSEALDGALSHLGPDLLVGYTPGYRGSAETGLGAWKASAAEPNSDHWASDHCFDPVSVPGVVFYSGDLSAFPAPSYRDIPAMAIDAAPDATGAAPPPTMSEEDQAKVEERLKSLGYL